MSGEVGGDEWRVVSGDDCRGDEWRVVSGDDCRGVRGGEWGGVGRGE